MASESSNQNSEQLNPNSEQSNPNSDMYTFACKSGNKKRPDKIEVDVGGVAMTFMIDSGSDCKIISRTMWESVKSKKVKCTSRIESRVIYPYASENPLRVVGYLMLSLVVI